MAMQDQAPLVEALGQAVNNTKRNGEEAISPLGHRLDIMDERVKRAESLAAAFYGAENTRFLTNGSTQGIHSLIMTACQPGDKILLPRNVHRSVLGGLILSGAVPVFVKPYYDEEMGLLRQIEEDAIHRALTQNPDCRAVLVVSPNYHGVAADLSRLAELCHARRIPLLVDEAHGPHFGIHTDLPASALQCGADGVVQSTHKLIGALTQSSMVHIQGNILDAQRFADVVDLLRPQVTSLILLASLDGARRQMALEGKALLSEAVSLAEQARSQINRIEGLKCFSSEEMSGAAFDPTKLTVHVSGMGITGPEGEQYLRRQEQIQAEYADFHNILFLITIADTPKTVDQLIAALIAMSQTIREEKTECEHLPLPEESWERVIPLSDAFYAESQVIPLVKSEGQVSHSVLCPYPPGIPVVYPGERLTRSGVEYLLEVWRRGIPVLGIIQKNGIPCVSVVRQEEEGWKEMI
jgi:arginine decarboxylase